MIVKRREMGITRSAMTSLRTDLSLKDVIEII
jgi:hypothetical protein